MFPSEIYEMAINNKHHNIVPLNALRLKTMAQIKKKLNNLPDEIIDFNITNIQDYMTKEGWEVL